MKKLILCALALVLAVAPLAACGSGEAPSAGNTPGTAEASDNQGAEKASDSIMWLSQGTEWDEQTQALRNKFKEETGIEVKGEFYSFNDLFEIIEVKIASGSSDYDVISVDVPMVAAYATRGYLAPMDEYFTEEEKAGWIPSALAAGSWQGTLYAPPMNTSSQLLWYNKDLLAEAGVTVRDSDVNNRLTYEEIADYAKTTLDVVDPDRNKGISGIVFQQVSRTYQMCAVPNSLGEKSIGDDGLTVDGVINSEGWVKALTWYQNLFNDGLALRGSTADEQSPNFNSGKTIFMIGGTWTSHQIGDTNFGYAPVPAFKGYEDKVGTPTGSWHFGINKASEKYDQAAQFIKYISLGEGNDLWLEENKDVPSTMRAIEAIQNDSNADPIQKIAAFEAANTAVPRALTPGYSEYSSVMDATFEDIRNGADVKGALDSAVEQINTAFEKYK